MKRAALTVGQEYLVHDSNDWNTSKPWSTPRRYRLLSLEKVSEVSYRYSPREREPFTIDVDGITYRVKGATAPYPHDKHQHAIMLRLENNTGNVMDNGTAVLVQFTKIRAPWAEGKAVVDEVHRKAQAAQAARDAALQQRTLRAQAISERAALLGVHIQPSVSSAATMAIPQDVLDRLLDMAMEGQPPLDAD